MKWITEIFFALLGVLYIFLSKGEIYLFSLWTYSVFISSFVWSFIVTSKGFNKSAAFWGFIISSNIFTLYVHLSWYFDIDQIRTAGFREVVFLFVLIPIFALPIGLITAFTCKLLSKPLNNLLKKKTAKCCLLAGR